MSSLAFILFAIATLAVAAFGVISRRQILYLRNFEDFHARFFKAADHLAEDGRTPEAILDFLTGMANSIRSRDVARHAVFNVVSGRARLTHIRPPEHFKKFRDAVKGVPADLMPFLAAATVAFAFAVSFRSVFFGWLLRRIVLFQLNEKNRDQHHNGNTIEKAEPVLSEIEPQACAA